MSLVNTLLNGGTYENDVTVESAKYSHSDGASRIAMESVAELHDIFMESFYNPEQAELAAATEGVALEGSQYEAVAEAAVSNAITKIKEFLRNLWAKVKAFFHNVRRYLDAIFMSGADFAKKYAQDIRNANGLKDFEFKMYKYDNAVIDDMSGMEGSVDDMMNEMIDGADNFLKDLIELADKDKDDVGSINAKIADKMTAFRKDFDRDAMVKECVSDMSGGKCKDPEDFDAYLFKSFRNGAADASDKEDVAVTNIDEYADILVNSAKLGGKVDKFSKKMDTAYGKAIKKVDDAEKKLAKYGSKVSGNVTEVLRTMSSVISIEQTYANKMMNAWKAVIKERDGAYKQLIMAGLAHAKKQKKSK